MGALLYDMLLITIGMWGSTLFLWVIANNGEAVTGWPVQIMLIGEMMVFYLFFWSRDGQTLGMTAWRIKLVDISGHPPTLRQLLIRLCTAPLSMAAAGLGYLWLYIGEAKRTWHDRISHTMVVYIPKSSL
jgi:uncharacterized RDD family membrane protein YckC